MPEHEGVKPVIEENKLRRVVSKISYSALPWVGILWMAASARLMFSYNAPFTDKLIRWSIIAGITFCAGIILDRISTIRTLRSLDHADELGIQHNTIETNPDLPDRPTDKELLFSRKHLEYILGIEAVGLLIPPIGIGLGVSGFFAAANNELVRLNVVRKINLVKDEIKAT